MSARKRRGRRAPFFGPARRADDDLRRRGGDLPVLQGERDGSTRCSVSTGTGGRFGTLDFGTRNGVDNTPVSTSFVADGALSIACTPGVALSMSIDGGQNYSSVRRMTRSGGTEVVGYRLYSSSSLAANSEIGVNQAIPITYTNSNNIGCLFWRRAPDGV